MKYTILAGDHESLSKQVVEYSANGWELHGTPYTTNGTHYQAMTEGANTAIQVLEPSELMTQEQPAPVIINIENLVKDVSITSADTEDAVSQLKELISTTLDEAVAKLQNATATDTKKSKKDKEEIK